MAYILLTTIWLWLIWRIGPQWSFHEDYHFGWAMPFLAGYLLWRRWVDRPQPDLPRYRAVPILLMSLFAAGLLPLIFIYKANVLWWNLCWPMGTAVIAISLGMLYLVGGGSWLRHFWFPFAFMIVGLPWLGPVVGSLISPLTQLNTRGTVEALVMCGLPAIQHGNVIEISTGQVGVDEACSGIRSFQVTLMIALFLGELSRLSLLRRMILLFGGIGLALACNMGRTFALTWVCEHQGMEALDRWHDPVGTAVLLTCFGGLWTMAVLLARPLSFNPSPHPMGRGFLRLYRRRPLEISRVPTGMSAAQSSIKSLSSVGRRRGIKAVAAGLIAWLLLAELGAEAWFRGRESQMVDNPKWTLELPVGKAAFQTQEMSESVMRRYWADQAESVSWAEPDGTRWQMFYFRWVPGSATADFARGHNPERCLTSIGKVLRKAPEPRPIEVHGVLLPFQAYTFDDGGLPLHVFHLVWEQRAGSAGELDLRLKQHVMSRVRAAWEGKRNLGQQVLELAIWGCKDLDTAEGVVLGQLKELIRPESIHRSINVSARAAE